MTYAPDTDQAAEVKDGEVLIPKGKLFTADGIELGTFTDLRIKMTDIPKVILAEVDLETEDESEGN